MTNDTDTVEVPRGLAEELADHHKEAARHFYYHDSTATGDRHHSYSRRLNEATGRDWNEVASER